MAAKCFECGKTVCHLYIPFYEKLKEKKEKNENNSDIFKDLKIYNLCCKNMVANSIGASEGDSNIQ